MIKITAKTRSGRTAMWIAEPGKGSYRTQRIMCHPDGSEEQGPYTYVPDNRIDEYAEKELARMRRAGWTNIELDR